MLVLCRIASYMYVYIEQVLCRIAGFIYVYTCCCSNYCRGDVSSKRFTKPLICYKFTIASE